jgi:hypothetical protein
MTLNTNTIVKSGNVYYRFWSDIKTLSPFACPIRNSPHYQFAKTVVQKAMSDNYSPLPEDSLYEVYCQWETICIGRKIGHSHRRYYKNIALWISQFDILNNIPELVRFDIDKYFIYDGLHRIAFMAACIDLGIMKDEIPITIITPQMQLPPVEGISYIEKHLEFMKRACKKNDIQEDD